MRRLSLGEITADDFFLSKVLDWSVKILVEFFVYRYLFYLIYIFEISNKTRIFLKCIGDVIGGIGTIFLQPFESNFLLDGEVVKRSVALGGECCKAEEFWAQNQKKFENRLDSHLFVRVFPSSQIYILQYT